VHVPKTENYNTLDNKKELKNKISKENAKTAKLKRLTGNTGLQGQDLRKKLLRLSLS